MRGCVPLSTAILSIRHLLLPMAQSTSDLSKGSDFRIFYGANDGLFRALDPATGREDRALIAEEHLEGLKRLQGNTPTVIISGWMSHSQAPSVRSPNATLTARLGRSRNMMLTTSWSRGLSQRCAGVGDKSMRWM